MKFATVEAYGLFFRLREFLQTCPELSQLVPQLKEAQRITLDLGYQGGGLGIITEDVKKAASHFDTQVHPAAYIAETMRIIDQEGWNLVETEGVVSLTDNINAVGALDEYQQEILGTLRECLKTQSDYSYPASDFREIYTLVGIERNDDWGADPSWTLSYKGRRYNL